MDRMCSGTADPLVREGDNPEKLGVALIFNASGQMVLRSVALGGGKVELREMAVLDAGACSCKTCRRPAPLRDLKRLW